MRRQMGLSFSCNWQHLKGIYKLKAAKNPGKSIDVYWVLEKSDLPTDLAFVQDERDTRHYFLTVTKQMTVESLVAKLKWIADRMAINQRWHKGFQMAPTNYPKKKKYSCDMRSFSMIPQALKSCREDL